MLKHSFRLPTRAVVASAILIAAALAVRFSSVLRAAGVEAIHYLATIPASRQVGTTPGTFTYPRAIAYDAAGRLYVGDDTGRLQVFRPDHTFLHTVDTNDAAPIAAALGVAFDADGKVLVSDWWNDQLVLFAAPVGDAPPVKIAAVGESGDYDPLEPNQCDPLNPVPLCDPDWYANNPWWHAGTPPLAPLVTWGAWGVAVKPGTHLNPNAPPNAADTGRVALVDNGNHRVVVMNSRLEPLYAFGGHQSGQDDPAGSLEYPQGIAIDAAGRYYLADTDNNRVQVFEEDSVGGLHARFVRMFGSAIESGGFGSSPGDFARPRALAFDPQGRLWVTDSERHRLIRIDVGHEIDTAGKISCATVISHPETHVCYVATDGQHGYEALVVGAHAGGAETAGAQAQFQYPSGVAIDASGHIAVADTDDHVVQFFDTPHLELAFQGSGWVEPGPHDVNTPIPFSVSLTNSGRLPLLVTLQPSALAGNQPFTGTFTGQTAGEIPPATMRPFSLAFTPGESGSPTIRVTASGEADVLAGGHVDGGTLNLDGGAVLPGLGVSMTAAASRTTGVVDDVIEITLNVRNTGEQRLTNALAAIDIAQAGSFVLPLDTPQPFPLEPTGTAGDAKALVYRFKLIGNGTAKLSPRVDAEYVEASLPPHTWTVNAIAPPLTITVTSDLTPPTTTSTKSDPNEFGWYNAPVTIHFAAVDNPGGSGVAATYFRVQEDNQDWRIAANGLAIIDGRGPRTVAFKSKDLAGNEEAEQTLIVRIDTVAPTMRASLITSQIPPANGWYRSNPTITFNADENLSGLAHITDSITVTTEGAGQAFAGFALDKAGNRSADTHVAVNVDKTPPTLTCAPTVAANALGWYTDQPQVTIRCAAADALSGLQIVQAVCPGNPVTTTAALTGAPLTGPPTASSSCALAAEGVWQVYGVATDVAGNQTTSPALTIRIDRTPPTVVCSTLSGGEIWPPNHKMVPWDVSVMVTDKVAGQAGFKLTGYSSSEAANARGDGNTSVDMSGWVLATPDTSGLVRSERSGPGTGRIYRLYYDGFDLAGNKTSCTSVLTEVPHDQGKK